MPNRAGARRPCSGGTTTIARRYTGVFEPRANRIESTSIAPYIHVAATRRVDHSPIAHSNRATTPDQRRPSGPPLSAVQPYSRLSAGADTKLPGVALHRWISWAVRPPRTCWLALYGAAYISNGGPQTTAPTTSARAMPASVARSRASNSNGATSASVITRNTP